MIRKQLLGHCSVDSGQLLVVDPCYVTKGKKYDRICDDNPGPTLKNKGSDEGHAVVVNTTYGDGSYPVYEGYGDGSRVLIVYLDNPRFEGEE